MAKQRFTSIHLQDGLLDWTTLKPRKGGAELDEHKQVSLEFASEQIPELTAPEMVAELKKALSGIKGEVGVSVPTEKVLLRVAELPSTEPEELQGMVELQIDKISPFPVEHMAVSYEVISQTESSSRVLIVGVRSNIIDALGESFGKAGHRPHVIDVDILGWWQLLADTGAVSDTGREVLLLLDRTGREMVVTHDGLPVLFRPLGVPTELTPEDVADVLDDIGYTLTTLEAEWGTSERIKVAVWSSVPVPGELMAGIQHHFGIAADIHQLDELPPLSEGLARRMARTRGTYINLAPPDWLQRERSRHTRNVLIAVTVVFLSVWIGGITAFMIGLNLQQKQLLQVQTKAQELDKAAEEARQLEEKVKSLEEYADRSHSALECLREVSILMPQGIDLTSFTYRKGKTVKVRGESANEGPIYDFISAMEKSDLFIEAKSGDIARKRRKTGAVTEFTVTAGLPGDES